MEKIKLSAEGYEKLKQELKYLRNVKKEEVAQRIIEARSMGDLKENSEYHAAKEEMAYIMARINEIEDILSNAEIISISKTDQVDIGATVTFQDLTNNKIRTYTFVASAAEMNIHEGKIPINNAFGQAARGKKQGDIITVITPKGKKQFKIIKISY